MGTNYYLYPASPCKACGRSYEAKHIGKSSAGWCFLLHVIPEEGINDLEDWKKLWYQPEAEINVCIGFLQEIPEIADKIKKYLKEF